MNHEDLISQAASGGGLAAQVAADSELSEKEISAVFGIELDSQAGPAPLPSPPVSPLPASASSAKRPKTRRKTRTKIKKNARKSGKSKR
jgi:hypothetical protein